MALTSIGYDGTVDELGFAQMMYLAGHRHVVSDRASFNATQVNGVRSVSISAGQAYAPGVRTVSDSAITVPLPAPSAGAWHLIVLRRNWETNSQSIEALTNSTMNTANTLPATVPTSYPIEMLTSAGAKDDQPLWWAWVNNQNVTVSLVDLRVLPGSILRQGNTSQRDTYWGTPATLAQGNALDGKTWENTQLNRTERYFGSTSTVSPGWYPTAGIMPMTRVGKTSAANIGNGTQTIVWNVVTFTTGNDFVRCSGSTFFIGRTGHYRITMRAALGAATTMILRCLVNGSVYSPLTDDLTGGGSAYPKKTMTDVVRLTAGDEVIFDIRSIDNALMDLPQCFALVEFVSPRLT